MAESAGINTRPSVLVLESVWSNDLSDNTSVRPFIEGWGSAIGVRVGFRTYHDVSDLVHWLREFKNSQTNPRICYIAGHGVGKRLQGVTGSNINLKSALIKVFPKNRGTKIPVGNKGILIGACEVGDECQLEEIVLNTAYPLAWIAGYKQSVPWMEATVCELLFLTYLLKGRSKKKWNEETHEFELDSTLTKSVKKVVSWVHEDYSLADSFGFSIANRK